MAVIQVQRKAPHAAERTYLPQIVGGMMTTLKHFFGPTETLQYPEERPAIPPGYRGVPTLVKDPHGREKCVSCQLCEFVCPPKAIRITPGSVPAGAGRRPRREGARRPSTSTCSGASTAACARRSAPEEAIFLQNQYSMSGYSRAEMVNHKDRLYELGGTLPDKHFKWDEKKAAEAGRRRAATEGPDAMEQLAFTCLSVFTLACALGRGPQQERRQRGDVPAAVPCRGRGALRPAPRLPPGLRPRAGLRGRRRRPLPFHHHAPRHAGRRSPGGSAASTCSPRRSWRRCSSRGSTSWPSAAGLRRAAGDRPLGRLVAEALRLPALHHLSAAGPGDGLPAADRHARRDRPQQAERRRRRIPNDARTSKPT